MGHGLSRIIHFEMLYCGVLEAMDLSRWAEDITSPQPTTFSAVSTCTWADLVEKTVS